MPLAPTPGLRAVPSRSTTDALVRVGVVLLLVGPRRTADVRCGPWRDGPGAAHHRAMHGVVIGKTLLSLVQGDITRQAVDAIVNAANSSLLGGGGVDGAIHRAGGPEILEACKRIRATQGQCPTGQAVITTGGRLPASRVIHTVGPVWNGGGRGEAGLLRSAYKTSLALAAAEGLRTVAFPSISTGAYGFPIARASTIALQAIAEHCRAMPDAHDEVRMVLFSAGDLAVYAEALGRLDVG